MTTIEALRTEAGEAGDLEQVAICDAALRGDAEALAEVERVLTEAAAGLATVCDYQTGEALEGVASSQLLAASRGEHSGSGAVGAVLRDGTWYPVAEDRRCGRVVYVEE